MNQATKQRELRRNATEYHSDDWLWEKLRGMWKRSKIDPVAYQKRIRKESDARLRK
ncbi:MAG: hypothetical protein AAB386_00490 [Patescibacteria group bacterium]